MKTLKTAGILCAAALLAAGYVLWGNSALQVSRYTVESTRLDKRLDGLTVLQISDLHGACFGRGNARLLAQINALSPDLIAVTGDLVDSRRGGAEAAVAFLREAVKLAPVYYVTGNHEARLAEYPALRAQLCSLGVCVLDGESDEFAYGGASLQLLGAPDPNFAADVRQLGAAAVMRQTLAALPRDAQRFSLLLSHRPELLPVYAEAGVDLALCGHAHGGQFRLPFVGGLFAPGQGVFPKYTAGIHTLENTQMAVSRGLGNSLFPFRLNNRPELLLITLKAV